VARAGLVARARLTADESLDLATWFVFLRSDRRLARALASEAVARVRAEERAGRRLDFFLLVGFKEPLCPAKRLEADFPNP
jgi:hypothetical protein